MCTYIHLNFNIVSKWQENKRLKYTSSDTGFPQKVKINDFACEVNLIEVLEIMT